MIWEWVCSWCKGFVIISLSSISWWCILILLMHSVTSALFIMCVKLCSGAAESLFQENLVKQRLKTDILFLTMATSIQMKLSPFNTLGKLWVGVEQQASPCSQDTAEPLSSFLPFRPLSSVLSPFASQPPQKTADCFHPPAAPAKGTEGSVSGSSSFWAALKFPNFHFPELKQQSGQVNTTKAGHRGQGMLFPSKWNQSRQDYKS